MNRVIKITSFIFPLLLLTNLCAQEVTDPIHFSNGIDQVILWRNTEYAVPANLDSTTWYYIHVYFDFEGKEYKQLEIVTQGQRVLEWTEPVRQYSADDILEIDDRREEWLKLCNAHDAKKLVYSLYAEDALYFNHKPLVIGRSDITEEYAYMNREQYQLDFMNMLLFNVSGDTAFEIGQCVGSYAGKYVLIWKKKEDGKWYVEMDSNI